LKLTIFCIVLLILTGNAFSQGITLLYKGGGGGGWNDPANWIQINTPTGQLPIQRAPTQLDDVVFDSLFSGISSVMFILDSNLNVGSSNPSGYQCKSLHVSRTVISFDYPGVADYAPTINIFTSNGGHVVVDSGSNVLHGYFNLMGGDSSVTDLQIVNSTYGTLFSHATWSSITWMPAGRAWFSNSTIGGNPIGSDSGGEIYAENCNFNCTVFNLGDHSTDTMLNCTVTNNGTNTTLEFHIGRNANFFSSNVNVTSAIAMDIYTSGAILNGNVQTQQAGTPFNFTQEDPSNPLPNIINGNVTIAEQSQIGIMGDLKISGNFEDDAAPLEISPDTSDIFINGSDIFEMGGIVNYANTDSISRCNWNYCHFNLEFFGNNNSNIYWPVGFPVDTLIINKSSCAKVTFTNPLYVSGQAKIESGQLVLNPNDSILYKFVCTGDVDIYQGGGIFLRRDSNNVVANMAVAGNINDYNLTVDSACAGLSNPYNGIITLYQNTANQGSHQITINNLASMGNLTFIGQSGTKFSLGGNLQVNNVNFYTPAKLILGDYNLIVNGNISNYGPSSYFVTNGLGYLQLNNIGSTATVFPEGTSDSSYTPATLTNWGTPDSFRISVHPEVFAQGTAGNAYIAGVVNKTWDIHKSLPGGANVSLSFQWNASDELNGFTRTASYVSHYTSGAWNDGPQMSASGTNPYYLAVTGVTGFSPFAVMSPAGVVPLTLLDFSGKYQGQRILLSWSTTNAINTNYFVVERSADAVFFQPLGDVSASPLSTGQPEYQYSDLGYLAAVNYYRLKMVDADGSFSYSETIPVRVPSRKLVTLFPDPVRDQLTVIFPPGSPQTTLSVVDLTGKTVAASAIPAGTVSITINTRDLAAGLYTVHVNWAHPQSILFVKK